MDNLIIKSGNYLLGIAGMYGLVKVLIWCWRDNLGRLSKSVIRAFGLLFLSTAVNASWFALSRSLSDKDSIWNVTMFEWRWLLIVTVAVIYLAGVVLFIEYIENHGMGAAIATGIGLIAISVAAGVFL